MIIEFLGNPEICQCMLLRFGKFESGKPRSSTASAARMRRNNGGRVLYSEKVLIKKLIEAVANILLKCVFFEQSLLKVFRL
jgi:hypothetical protein